MLPGTVQLLTRVLSATTEAWRSMYLQPYLLHTLHWHLSDAYQMHEPLLLTCHARHALDMGEDSTSSHRPPEVNSACVQDTARGRSAQHGQSVAECQSGSFCSVWTPRCRLSEVLSHRDPHCPTAGTRPIFGLPAGSSGAEIAQTYSNHREWCLARAAVQQRGQVAQVTCRTVISG